MWRAFCCAIGISALVLGGEFLVIERATLTLPIDQATAQRNFLGEIQQNLYTKEFVPPEWAPWTLLSFGAVTVLCASGIAKE